MTTKITFTLPAEAVEGATEAILLGDFNNWNPEKAPKLERQQDGSFKAVAQLEAGHTYQYRFLLDNSRWVNDYHAQGYTNVQGYHIDNCVITVPEPIAEENKKSKPAKESATGKKVAKAEPAEKVEQVAAKSTKKAAEKSTAPKAVKTKSADEKAQSKKAEKPAKAVKKAAAKAKK